MPIQLRVCLPDQPGALSRVTQAIARLRVDVISVSVLESDAGRAIDDFRLRWPDGKPVNALIESVAGCTGVQVIGCRRTRWALGDRPELDLLRGLIAAPERGVETLVDMAPVTLDADWAELRPPARRLPAMRISGARPHDDRAPLAMPVRGMAGVDEWGAWAHIPISSLHAVLVVGRDDGVSFVRSEVAHAERVVDLAMKTLDRVLRDSGSTPAVEVVNFT
jgi:hypothetical protein